MLSVDPEPGQRHATSVASNACDTNGTAALSDISPRDKPWDTHRAESDIIGGYYNGSEFQRYSDRIDDCSQLLGFGLVPDSDQGVYQLKLRTARFCKVRTCMVCAWRRSLMYKARAYKALPAVIADYPKARYLFMTLTCKNCDITDLRETIKKLNKGFERLVKLKDWPGLGYIKTVETTRGKDGISAHPHLHILVMVKPSYFGVGYIKKKEWCQLWKRSLRVDYTPIMDVQAIKPNDSPVGLLSEIIKYQAKPTSLTHAPREWFLEYTRQIRNTKAFTLGGIFKEYFRELDKEETTDEMIGSDEEGQDGLDEGELLFGWRRYEKKYRMIDS